MFSRFSRDQKVMLAVLTLINFVNYVDRQVIFPLFQSIKDEFHVNDFQLGLLGTVFMLVHSLSSVPLGMLADRVKRTAVIGWGVVFWSFTSFASGAVRSFHQLLFTRSMVGIGEAAYAPAATAMLSENFPAANRASVQGVYNVGMFIGGTLGAILGGLVVSYLRSWRMAFFIVAIPGIFLAYFAWKLHDSRDQYPDAIEIPSVKTFLHNHAYRWILISGIFASFAAGGFIAWGVEFVRRYKGYSLKGASVVLGLTMLLAGIIGVVAGSYLADAFHKRGAWGRSVVISISLIISVPFVFLGLREGTTGVMFLFYFFMGISFFSFFNGPITAVIHDILPKRIHGSAFAFYLLVIHLFGDTLAPAVVGKISDLYDLRAGLQFATWMLMASGLTFLPVVWLIARKKVLLFEN